MKRHQHRHAGLAGDRPGLPRRQVSLPCCVGCIGVEKCALDEQQVRASNQTHDATEILIVEGRVRDIGDLLARDEPQRTLAQQPERKCSRSADIAARCGGGELCVVRCASEHGMLRLPQPGAWKDAKLLETVGPDIDVRRLLDREGETWCAVVEHGVPHRERRLDEQCVVLERQGVQVTAREALARVELSAMQSTVAAHLVHGETEINRVVLDEVPGECGQLVPDLLDEAGRSIERERARSSEAHAQEPVETEEVVHVGVRHENVAGAEQLARRECRDVSEVEEHGPPLEQHVHEQRRIAERSVDQSRLEDRAHVLIFGRSADGRQSGMSAGSDYT